MGMDGTIGNQRGIEVILRKVVLGRLFKEIVSETFKASDSRGANECYDNYCKTFSEHALSPGKYQIVMREFVWDTGDNYYYSEPLEEVFLEITE